MITHSGRPSIVALLRTPALIAASAKHRPRQATARCAIQLATTVQFAETQLSTANATLLLLEIDEPNDSQNANVTTTLDWLQRLHAQHHHLQSVVLSSRCDADSVVAALCAGAAGYLVKDPTYSAHQQIQELIIGLEQLANGTPPLSDSVLPHLVHATRNSQSGTTSQGQRSDLATGDVRLSKRENEVLSLAAKGFTYAEMATLLNLSVHTISTHTRRIYAKLEVNSRCAAIYEATQQGLLLDRSAA